MKCLRCGYCCSYPTVIIHPEDVEEFNGKDYNAIRFIQKENGVKCPYYSYENEEAKCSIHDKEWFKDFPCGRHGQVESNVEDECRIGRYMRDKKEDQELFYK